MCLNLRAYTRSGLAGLGAAGYGRVRYRTVWLGWDYYSLLQPSAFSRVAMWRSTADRFPGAARPIARRALIAEVPSPVHFVIG